FCLDCGHTWRDKEDKKNCKCPHCGMNLKLENSRKRTAVYKEYFCVITTYKQYQVIRFFMVDCRLKKGSPANYFIIEAVQCWMNKEGKTETLSLLRGMSIFYYDAWIYGSSLELRKRNVHHDRIYDICPAVIYPRMKVIPELTRNGFKGAFYDICPSSFFMTLLTDNRMEILYKAGQMNLFLRFLERKYGIDKYWTYVKICLRHDYVIHDADLWLDYVDMLIENKLDARNPHYLCPLNVEEAHDWVMGKCKKKYSEKDEKDYIAAKSRFFNLSFADGNIMVRVLESLSDFYKEGKLLHHCVFSNAYYKREDSLIMSATVDGRRMETVEFSLSRMEVCQCRGKSNQLSAYHDRILNLVRDNIPLIRERMVV
ncbi:PcfJ domain-containing protein, partial [Phocaeicola vulgatus]